jgi:hypothetical protein
MRSLFLMDAAGLQGPALMSYISLYNIQTRLPRQAVQRVNDKALQIGQGRGSTPAASRASCCVAKGAREKAPLTFAAEWQILFNNIKMGAT